MNTNKPNNIIPKLEPNVKFKAQLQADDWLCIACNKKITSEKERFEYNNQSEFQFINPGGFYDELIRERLNSRT